MKFEETPHISPQTAMDDYFQDMFGHVADDPLKKLEAEEQAELKKQRVSLPEHTSAPKPSRVKPKKSTKQMVSTDFAEPKTNYAHISPLIIPAAFPKLAPLAEAKRIETKAALEVDEKIVAAELISEKTFTQTKTLLTNRQKLDKKTALSILLKQQQKLSSAQRLRLKEKLKQLEQKKQLAAQSSAIKTSTLEDTLTAPVQSKSMTEPKTEVLLKTSAEPSRETAVLIDSSAKHLGQAKPEYSKDTRPEWSESRFECLLFSVAGLKLAVPLISLGAIYKIEKELTPLVGRASWFMGLYHHLDRNVRVVDTAQWVMPERCTAQIRENYKFIIRLGGSDWGMACDAVHQSIRLYPDQVKWRSGRTKRVWLYGTVIEHMCALIDAEALNSMLEQQAPIKFSH